MLMVLKKEGKLNRTTYKKLGERLFFSISHKKVLRGLDEREGKEYSLRPDAEFKVGEELYTLEIDRSTESYNQLVQKFKNYKHYMDYVKLKKELFPIRKIIFGIEDTERDFCMSRRWGTIFKAYLEGMGITSEYRSWPDVDIIFTTVSGLASVVEHDINMRKVDCSQRVEEVVNLLKIKQFTDKRFERYEIPKDNCAIYLQASNGDLLYTASYPYYTSAFYRYLTDFYSNGKGYFGLRSDYLDLSTVLITNIHLKNWIINWKNSNVHPNVYKAIDIRLGFVRYLKHHN